MELWHILVLSVVRLGLYANYDRLEDFANHHNLIRQINEVVISSGHRLVKKKAKDCVLRWIRMC
jgi:hypothetical protein